MKVELISECYEERGEVQWMGDLGDFMLYMIGFLRILSICGNFVYVFSLKELNLLVKQVNEFSYGFGMWVLLSFLIVGV